MCFYAIGWTLFIFNFRSAIRVPTSQLYPPTFINFCQQTFTNTKNYFDAQLHVSIFKENIKFSHKNDEKFVHFHAHCVKKKLEKKSP